LIAVIVIPNFEQQGVNSSFFIFVKNEVLTPVLLTFMSVFLFGYFRSFIESERFSSLIFLF